MLEMGQMAFTHRRPEVTSVVDGPTNSHLKMAAPAVATSSGAAPSSPDLTQEEHRRRTFDSWPQVSPTMALKLARAGFYHVGRGRTRCFSCGTECGDWRETQGAVERHRTLSPDCAFLRSVLGRSPPEPDEALLKRSAAHRLRTFARWPLDFLDPTELARAGFYYLQQDDRVRCAFCRGTIHNWERGDDPLVEHGRHFPCCPFLLDPSLEEGQDECGRSWREQRSHSERGAAPPVEGGHSADSPLSLLGITPHAGPKHPAQASPDARLRSFAKWPPASPLRPPDLVKAGFFYIGILDYTKCFHCDGGLCNWERGDDPWEEHARWFPKCQFVLLSKGDAFVRDSVQKHLEHMSQVARSGSAALAEHGAQPGMETEVAALLRSGDVQFYVDQGVDRETLRVALLAHVQRQQRGFSSRDELIQVLASLFSLHRRQPEAAVSSTADFHQPSSGAAELASEQHAAKEEPPRTPQSAEGPAHDPEELQLENLRLKEQRLCKICLDAEVGVVFLPCGHLVACPACAASIKDCPVCRKTIVGAVRTFLS
uniref:Putative inhibitor of apoptosis protein 1 and 2 iap1 iap2 n=2 Tax=Ixodes ricinus TaxID=34613 RepID=A0A131XUQ0_IXORI